MDPGFQAQIFSQALNIHKPWYLTKIEFMREERRLDIWVDFERGAKFACPDCAGEECIVHDTVEKEWRHLDFFQFRAYIHCRVPRVVCEKCGIRLIEVPWSRKSSGFTSLFEAMIVLMAGDMQVSQIGEKVQETDTRLWRIIKYYVKKAVKGLDLSKVTAICVDETSEKKGHKYITVFADPNTRRVIYVCKGKDADTLGSFFINLLCHHGNPGKIKGACCDMSPAYIKGIGEYFENAQITFDKFHVMMIVNKGVDAVRRTEQKITSILKKTRYIWLKNPENLTSKQADSLGSLKNINLKTVRAYQMKLNLKEFWNTHDRPSAEQFFKKWYFWVTHSNLPPMIDTAKTLKHHLEGILNYFVGRGTNGFLEAINGTIQSLKRTARGYRNTDNFVTMIYLRCGKLQFNLPI
jgi:transposase